MKHPLANDEPTFIQVFAEILILCVSVGAFAVFMAVAFGV